MVKEVDHSPSGKRFRSELLSNVIWLKIGGLLLISSGLLVLTAWLGESDKYYLNYYGFSLAALVMIIQGFKFWFKKYIGMVLHLTAALLNAFLVFVYWRPDLALFALSLWFLCISYLVIGIFRIYTASTQGLFYLGWGGTCISGAVNLILALIIYLQFFTHPTAVSLVTSVDFFFTGIALLMLGRGASHLKPASTKV